MKTKPMFRQGNRWLLCCIALATFVLQYVVHAACCMVGDEVPCAQQGGACTASSPNCGVALYGGTVTDNGTRTTVTGIGHGAEPGSGRDGTVNNGPCTYVCTITADCNLESPEVNGTGSDNMAPSGNPCP
jgi:hypothetical protein